MKLAVIAGESSGDQLGGDLVQALARRGEVADLVGVGGPALASVGLVSRFDYSELSIMGISAVLRRLPQLVRRIGEAADAIIAARPDALLIIDAPDFTHRVARKVRTALPGLPVIDYVCPSVWAWKEHRARQMTDYVDLVLAILPFEPEVMRRLGGPKTVYVGHRLTTAPEVLAAREANRLRWEAGAPGNRTILLLPGSRRSEVDRLLDAFAATANELAGRMRCRFVLPAVPHLAASIRARISSSAMPIEVVEGAEAKWAAFARADAALAASGTAILELALSGVPVVSTYRPDWLIRLAMSRIRTWSAALPNLVLDKPSVPEFFNEMVRPGLLARHLEQLASGSLARQAMLADFAALDDIMATPAPAGELAAEQILKLLAMRP